MRTALAAALSTAILAMSFGTAVMASDKNTIYYSGAFSCDGKPLRTDWSVRKDAADKITATVYYRQASFNQVQWLELTERKSQDGDVLVDANGNPRLAVAIDGSGLRANWIKGAPGTKCSPVSVDKSESPKDRLDKLFTLLDTAKPSADDAKQAAETMRALPIFEALPQLDQQSYVNRYGQSVPIFWKRYRQALSEQIEQLPLASEADRLIASSRMQGALSTPLLASTRSEGANELSAILGRLSDRLADAGAPMAAAFDMSDANALCGRLRDIKEVQDSRGYRVKDLEFVSGVSFDYWTRDMADAFLDGAKSCGGQEQLMSDLTSNWSAIQQRQQLIAAIKGQRDRLLSLPVTMQTLIDTKNLRPDVQSLKVGYDQSDLVERLLGKALEGQRDALLSATIASIRQQASAYSLDKPDIAKNMDANCDALSYSANLSNDKVSRIRQECDVARSSIATTQASDAVKKIEAAFASAQPLTPSAEMAKKLCSDITVGLSSQALQTVLTTCQTQTVALKTAEAAKLCSDAVENSGASPGLLETTVTVAGLASPTKATLKDLVCKASEHSVKLSFHSTGVLMWSAQRMDMLVTRGGKEQQLHFLLAPAPSDVGANWAVTTDDDDTKQKLLEERLRVELVSACFMGSSACQAG